MPHEMTDHSKAFFTEGFRVLTKAKPAKKKSPG